MRYYSGRRLNRSCMHILHSSIQADLSPVHTGNKVEATLSAAMKLNVSSTKSTVASASFYIVNSVERLSRPFYKFEQWNEMNENAMI